MARKKFQRDPEYAQGLADKLEAILPPDCAYTLVAQPHDDEDGPVIVTTCDNGDELARCLRSLARHVGSDA
jgi:hypothetical protein